MLVEAGGEGSGDYREQEMLVGPRAGTSCHHPHTTLQASAGFTLLVALVMNSMTGVQCVLTKWDHVPTIWPQEQQDPWINGPFGSRPLRKAVFKQNRVWNALTLQFYENIISS